MTVGSEIDVVDMHAHFSTRKGFVFQTREEIERAEENFNRTIEIRTEDEMVQDFHDAGVQAMLRLGMTHETPIEETREIHDYAADVISAHPETLLGIWLDFDPSLGAESVEEFTRCIEELDMGIPGLAFNGSSTNLPPSDESYHPFYELCIEHGLPVKINLGYTGIGARHPGGDGHLLEYCHPRYVDELAATFPELKIILGRPAWPWQSDATATLMHKSNIVGYELHGWMPKYWPEELKHDVVHHPAMKGKIMFGTDYPLFSYENLYEAWEAELDLSREQFEDVYYNNAKRILNEYDAVDF